MPQQKEIEKTFISVTGMTCGGCLNKTTNALKAVKGVSKAEVSLEKAMAYVEYDPAVTDLKKLENVILELGYEANDRTPEKPHMEMEEMHSEMSENAEMEHSEKVVTLIGDGDMKYTCPMEVCQVFSATADARCTECGMKLREMKSEDKERLEKLLKEYKVKKVKK
ncbi:MAG: heavy-metal-associated domain-containing protein [bacterium]|nr:heavy-metal-associated domain-containing protein [bacterium]